MLIFETFVSLWLNECDGCVTLQDPNFVTFTFDDQISIFCDIQNVYCVLPRKTKWMDTI